MKDLSQMTFGELLQYVRKSNKDIRTRQNLARLTNISSYSLAAYEKDERLPSKKELDTICDVLESEILREKGSVEIEYKRTHPKVQVYFSDQTTCWNCGGKMRSVYGLIDDNPIPPDIFNDEMLRISREKGVILEERESKTTGHKHLVNVCPNCNAFIGEFYLHELWYGETEVIDIDDVSDFIRDEE